MLNITTFPNIEALSRTLANKWLSLVTSIPATEPCTFALAGGTTPEPIYRHFDSLFAAAHPRKIQLVATDERWVDNSDPQSNEGLLQRCLSQSASHWELISLKNNQPTPACAITDINSRLKDTLPHPFNAVLLGMGTDGHIASLFPNAPHLLNKNEPNQCVAASHPQTQQERISLSFSRLLNTNSVWIIITGSEKRALLENVHQTNSVTSPIGAFLAAAHCNVDVFWCP